jgi:hypothetical protein
MAVNGTYHSRTTSVTRREFRGRSLAVVGLVLIVVGGIGGVRTNADMVAIEEASSPQNSQVGTGLTRLLPSIFTTLGNPYANFNTPTRAPDPYNPRTQPGYVEEKRALERWIALAGVGFACLLFGVDDVREAPPPAPEGTIPEHVSVTSDVARFVLLAAIAWGAFSFFETGG